MHLRAGGEPIAAGCLLHHLPSSRARFAPIARRSLSRRRSATVYASHKRAIVASSKEVPRTRPSSGERRGASSIAQYASISRSARRGPSDRRRGRPARSSAQGSQRSDDLLLRASSRARRHRFGESVTTGRRTRSFGTHLMIDTVCLTSFTTRLRCNQLCRGAGRRRRWRSDSGLSTECSRAFVIR